MYLSARTKEISHHKEIRHHTSLKSVMKASVMPITLYLTQGRKSFIGKKSIIVLLRFYYGVTKVLLRWFYGVTTV